MIPNYLSNVTLENTENVFYLYNFSNRTATVLENETSVKILSLVNGINTIEDIAHSICDIFDECNLTEVTDDIVDFIKILENENFLKIN